MFTWVCPKCGREVPPSSSECPDCAGQASTAPPATRSVPLHQPGVEPTPPVAKPQGPRVRRPSLPIWLLAAIFALGFAVLALTAYVAYRHFRGGTASLSATSGGAAASARMGSTSATPGMRALLEALEITGLRLLGAKDKKPEVVFVVVNHSGAPLTDISGTVTLRPSTAKPATEIVGIFAFQHVSLGPFESRELRAPLKTTLRMFELPDWEFLKTDLALSAIQ